MMTIDEHIKDHASVGCEHAAHSLGAVRMPEGYALMLDGDRTHFYWLRHDGRESAGHWDRWAIYRSAKRDSEGMV